MNIDNSIYNKLYKKIDELQDKVKPRTLDDIFNKEYSDDDQLLDLINDIASDIYDLVIAGIDFDEIMQGLINKYRNNQFWDIVGGFLENSLEAYNDTKFLTSYEDAQRQAIYAAVLDNILVQDDRSNVINRLDISNFELEKYQIIYKLMNTCLTQLFGHNLPQDIFCDYLKGLCNIAASDAKYIFQYIQGKKHDYQNYYLLRKITTLTEGFHNKSS